jgi:hypothetical protein
MRAEDFQGTLNSLLGNGTIRKLWIGDWNAAVICTSPGTHVFSASTPTSCELHQSFHWTCERKSLRIDHWDLLQLSVDKDVTITFNKWRTTDASLNLPGKKKNIVSWHSLPWWYIFWSTKAPTTATVVFEKQSIYKRITERPAMFKVPLNLLHDFDS